MHKARAMIPGRITVVAVVCGYWGMVFFVISVGRVHTLPTEENQFPSRRIICTLLSSMPSSSSGVFLALSSLVKIVS